MAEYALSCDLLKKAKKALTDAEERRRDAEEAQEIAQNVAKGVQEQAHKRIASVVTRCLRTVFADQPYELKVVFEKRRGKTEADLVLCRDGMELRDPINEVGLGVVDVASFALRLVRLLLVRPKRRRVLVADEPFKWLHGDENRQRMAELLLTLSKEFGVQIIMTTGSEWLRIGKVIDLSDGQRDSKHHHAKSDTGN